MADDYSSTCNRQILTSSNFSSLSPPSQHKNVVLVHDNEQQKQQQQQQLYHGLRSNNFVCEIRKSCAEEVADYEFIQKEFMFDKVVTPNDVGKRNRLVIPKRNGEKYFPSTTNNEKGLLLSFEDRNGKPWRFRYSYWSSSQSYVMTTGWGKFVKENGLDAGDTVYFGRGATESYKDRYYIDWKHQPYSLGDLSLYFHHLTKPLSNFSRMQNLAVSSLTSDHFQSSYDRRQHHYCQPELQQRLLPFRATSYGNYSNIVSSNNQAGSGPVMHVRSTSSPVHDRQAHEHQYQQAGLMQQKYPTGHNHNHMEMILNSVPVVHGKAATKRVRLFGVNLECLVSEDA
ncbi:hypothetical protein MKW98_018309 [Papaver atlanticum]|uniref:TF-B3 domain-containing protein n=1 Tax=Papaver atlanticum TaxID=357466 RepID=A0AAD4T7H4_9MAGN|nr:hypothetical protein MKW98_018309 [Papaver atlanticum]